MSSLTLTPVTPGTLTQPIAADTLWDAKGDLAVGSGPDTASRLAVGTNGYVLTADSAQTLGIKWAAIPGGGMVADTIWDAKGDLAVGTGADTASRLAVGSNNQVLTADSTQSTGVKWATPAAGGGIHTLISTTTLGSAATFDLTSISGSYNDLYLVMLLRSNSSGTTSPEYVFVNFNNVSTATYYNEEAFNSGTTASSVQDLGQTFGYIGHAPPGAGAANSFSIVELLIPGYASTTRSKVWRFSSFALGAKSSGNLYVGDGGGVWDSTAAITRVTIISQASGGLFAIGSQVRLYGRT